MMKLWTASNETWISVAALAALLACGGDDAKEDTSDLADANRTASSDTKVPDSCQRQADCPSGYACVPPKESFKPALDQDCYDSCSATCSQAGPFADMCAQDCTPSCTAETPPPDGSLNGKCLANQGGENGDPDDEDDTSSNGAGGGGSNTSASIQWANTWTVDVEYSVNCNWANTATQTGSQKYTLTMQVTGANSSPKASLSGGFALEGTGADDRMTLTGDFPLRNWKGETASVHSLNSPNEATIRMTTVESSSKASGTIEGQWDSSSGWKCKTSDGKITLSR